MVKEKQEASKDFLLFGIVWWLFFQRASVEVFNHTQFELNYIPGMLDCIPGCLKTVTFIKSFAPMFVDRIQSEGVPEQ